MPDEQPQNNEQPKEVRGKLLTPDEISDWGMNTRIVEPGARTSDGKVIGGTQEPAVEEPELNTVEESVQAAEPEQVEPETIITAEDPGEYVPNDYSFQVTVYDDEGKNGKQVTIKSVEQWDELLESDPNLGNAAALAKGLRQAAKMESEESRDKADYDKRKEAYDSEVADQERQTAATQNMANEIAYLVESNDLPEVDSKYKDANWSDPEVAKQPGIKEQIALLTFMRDENNRRHRLGLPAMTSVIDAFNAHERASSKTREINQGKVAAQERKAAGSIVAPASPSPQTNAPKGIKVGRGGSLQDLSFNSW